MHYFNVIVILPTVNSTSAERLPQKANIDAPVYTRQGLCNISKVVNINAKNRILPFGAMDTIQKLKINKKPSCSKQQYRKTNKIKQHGVNTSNLVQIPVGSG